MGFSDHAKQRFVGGLAVNHPLRVEYFMAAMLTVCLSKHHELYIGWIASKFGERLGQIINLIVRECKS